MSEHFLSSVSKKLLNRRTRWRLGRSVYMTARNDVPNNMKTNGEERLLLEFLSNFARTGERAVLFDVGANVGDWTCAAISGIQAEAMTNRVELHAFEPVHATYSILETNLSKMSGTSFLKLRNTALSDRNGNADIFVFGEAGGTNSLYPDELTPTSGKESIQLTTMDSYCQENNIQHVDLIKCDTEGNEVKVLTGAADLIKQERISAFQFEYNHRWVYSRHYLKDVFDLIKNTNYRLGKLYPGGVELFPGWHPELERFFEGNYLILHNNAMDRVTWHEGQFDAANTFDFI